MNRPPNIHCYEHPRNGFVKYAVCTRDKYNCNWHRPLDSHERKASGCTGEVGRMLHQFGDMTRTRAYSRANTLYGYAKIDKDWP